MVDFTNLLEKGLSFGELSLQHLQYLALVVAIKVSWPETWRLPLSWVKMFSFNFDVPELHIPAFDYRIYFLCLCVALPLVLTFAILLFFKPLVVLVWYFGVLASLAAIVAGGFGMAMGSRAALPGPQVVTAKWLIIIGCAMLGLCAIVFIGYAIHNRVMLRDYVQRYKKRMLNRRRVFPVDIQVRPRAQKKNKRIADVNAEELDGEALQAWEEAAKMKVVNEPRPSMWYFLWNVLTAIVIGFIGLLSSRIINTASLSKSMGKYSSYLDSPIFKLGTIAGICLLVLAGLILLYTLILLFQFGRNFIRHLKIFLNEQFIRIVLFALMIIYIPVTNVLMTAWSCSVVTLVKYHTHFIQQLKVTGEEVEDRWKQRISLSRNSAKSLYLAFELKWRYYKVALLVQKLVVVVVTIFLELIPKMCAICLTVLYTASFLLGAISQPYIHRALDFIATASALALILSSATATALAYGANVPGVLLIVVTVLNFALPVLELWKCRNGYYKERLRAVQDGNAVTSGLALRPFCSREFTPGAVCSFGFSTSSTDGHVAAVLCDEVDASLSSLSSDVLIYLW
eukprot:m51a1_g12230 hypothetical protein (569) ;mRNA; f:75498-78484